MLEIILVDDAREDSLLAERVLRQQCKITNPITFCAGGTEAMELMDARLNEGRHFLMFLDLVMAPVSGVAVVRHWKSLSNHQNSVIVMVSGLRDINAIHEGYQLGARTFVLKPLNREDMLEVLKGLSNCIRIEETQDGYILHWAGGQCGPGKDLPLDPAARRVVTITA